MFVFCSCSGWVGVRVRVRVRVRLNGCFVHVPVRAERLFVFGERCSDAALVINHSPRLIWLDCQRWEPILGNNSFFWRRISPNKH